MALDLAAILVLLAAASSGALQGALHQAVHLAGLAVGWAAAWTLGPAVGRGLSRWLPPTAARGAGGLLLFLGFSILAAWVGHRLLAAEGVRGAVRSAPDRGLGALLGGAKAALVVWVALSALALAGGRVALGRFAVDGAGSDLAALARQHDLLVQWTPAAARALERLAGAARDPAEAERLAADPSVRRLAADPRLRAFLDGDRRGGRRGEGEELERARRALEILDDPELRAVLERLGRDVPEPVREGAPRAR